MFDVASTKVASALPGRLPSRCFGGMDPGNHSGLSAAAYVRTVALGAYFPHVSPHGTQDTDLEVIVIPCIFATMTIGKYCNQGNKDVNVK